MTPRCSDAKTNLSMTPRCSDACTLVSCSEAFNYLPTEFQISFSCGLFVKAWVCPKLSFKIHDIFPITAHRPGVELGIPVKQVENCAADVRSRDSSNHQGKWFAFIFRHGWLSLLLKLCCNIFGAWGGAWLADDWQAARMLAASCPAANCPSIESKRFRSVMEKSSSFSAKFNCVTYQNVDVFIPWYRRTLEH